MKLTNLLSISVLLLLASCSPKVVTNLIKTYPNPVPADSVRVFELGETVPNTAEAIGRVSVIDPGTATKCRYDEVVHLAQEAVGKAGGNGFAITWHEDPSFWRSSCHQISGLMLYLKDNVVDTLRANPVQYAIDMNFVVARDKKQPERRGPAPANTFEVSLGYGWISSKIYDANNVSLGSKSGLEWKLGYEHIWTSGWGVGMQYSGFKAELPGGDMVLSYLAPEVTLRTKFNKWILKCGVGMGLFLYNEPYYSTAGFGTHIIVGVEYMLSSHVGLGVSASSIASNLPKRDGVELKKDEKSGINRVNVLGGLRFYF